jgi:hypothetical protein
MALAAILFARTRRSTMTILVLTEVTYRTGRNSTDKK